MMADPALRGIDGTDRPRGHSVDITVTECPNIDPDDFRRLSVDTENSDLLNCELDSGSLDFDHEAEFPDRISPLGFKSYLHDRLRSNSLPGCDFREHLTPKNRQTLKGSGTEGLNGLHHIDSTFSDPTGTNTLLLSRPVALRVHTPDDDSPFRRRLLSHPALFTGNVSSETAELCEEIARFSMFKPISPGAMGCLSPARSPTRSPMSSRPNSPSVSARSLSPVGSTRQRSHTICGRLLEPAPLIGSPRLPRDPIQPTQGSISDLTERHSNDESEEHDGYNLGPLARPRSRTCPENRAWKRRLRARANNRPPTPPPLGDLNFHFTQLLVKDKKVLSDPDIPEVGENT